MTLSLRWMYVCMCACMYVCKEGSVMYKIRGAFHLDCNSEKEIQLITSKKCKKQYVGSCITKFRTCFNNSQSRHSKCCKDHCHLTPFPSSFYVR